MPIVKAEIHSMQCPCIKCPHHHGRLGESKRVTVAIWKDGESEPLGTWVETAEFDGNIDKDIELFRLLAQSLFQGAVRKWLKVHPPMLVFQTSNLTKKPLTPKK